MTPHRLLSAFALATVFGFVNAQAQTPLFNDGTALGGSQVFSEGLNPLGNSARFDQIKQQTLGFTYLKGDQQASDFASALKDLAPGTGLEPMSNAIRQLADSPWSTRSRSYGMCFVADTINSSYTREEFNSVLVAADTLPANLNTVNGLEQNLTRADLRFSKVDRVAAGIGSASQGMGTGFSIRMERWNMGTQTAALNPAGTDLRMDGSSDLYALRNTAFSTTTVALDLGFTYEMAAGVRLGGTVNRLNAKRLWDVEEKPQGRVGLQVDIGDMARLSLETDVNETMRMPFPIKQRTSSASLRLEANPTITLILGAERRKLGESQTTRAGASLQIHLSGWNMGFGMQFSKDRPLQGFSVLAN